MSTFILTACGLSPVSTLGSEIKCFRIWLKKNNNPFWVQQSISLLSHPVLSVFAVSSDTLICSACLERAVNCHGSVVGLWVFLPVLTQPAAALPTWLITASLHANAEAAAPRADPSPPLSESFHVALISLCVARVVKEQKRRHLRPPSLSRNGSLNNFREQKYCRYSITSGGFEQQSRQNTDVR